MTEIKGEGLWHVKYEDSDSEDMDEKELAGARKLYLKVFGDADDDYAP